jgi:glycyl-tRNA synthetase
MTHHDETRWQDEVDALSAQVTKQGTVVRQLKKDGASADAIAEAVEQLQHLKIQVETIRKEHMSEVVFPRKDFDDLILRKMFVVPSFEIHGGVKGLFDLGPPACALKVRMSESKYDKGDCNVGSDLTVILVSLFDRLL